MEVPAPAASARRQRQRVLCPREEIKKALAVDQPKIAGPSLDHLLASQWGKEIAGFLAQHVARGTTTGAPVESDSSDELSEVQAQPRAAARSRSLNTRSAHRLRKLLESDLDDLSFLSFLENCAVAPTTARKYHAAVKELKEWAAVRGWPMMAAGEIDAAMVGFFNQLFLEGENPWRGELALAGLLHVQPELGKAGVKGLPRCLRCLKGWRRLCPTKTKVPWGWDLWCAVAAELCRLGYLRVAIAVLVGVDCYLRPSELLGLTPASLVPPSPESSGAWALLLHPSSRFARSKVGESDETLLLNSDRLRFLQPVFEVLAKTGRDDVPLWNCDYPTFFKLLTGIGKRLGVSLVPYAMRHSGVTIDRAERKRSQEEAQRRGRWKQASSMRRYEKSGRLGDSWRQLGPSVQTHCQQMRGRIAEFVVGGAMPPPPPVL